MHLFCSRAVSFPCTVQHEAIPQALMRQDILCQAKSGMGKTAVFVISILQNLEPKKGVVQGLVLCHTRELSFQVGKPKQRRRTDQQWGAAANKKQALQRRTDEGHMVFTPAMFGGQAAGCSVS